MSRNPKGHTLSHQGPPSGNNFVCNFLWPVKLKETDEDDVSYIPKWTPEQLVNGNFGENIPPLSKVHLCKQPITVDVPKMAHWSMQ